MIDNNMIDVPLHQVQVWKFTCTSCKTTVDTGSGVIGKDMIKSIICPTCKSDLLTNDMRRVFEAVGNFCRDHNRSCDISLSMMRDRCNVVPLGLSPRGVGENNDGK